MAPLKMANDARSCPTLTAATATDTKGPLAAATATWTTWTRATLAPAQAKSIVMNLYLDCDSKDAAKIVGAANRATRALCQLDSDSEVPSTKHLVIMQGPDHEVKKAKGLIESQLEELHMELSGHKPMHVSVEGVGESTKLVFCL